MKAMLKDKIAIITGSGRGIGKAAALRFAEEGAKVVVSDIDPEPAEETVAEIKQTGGEAVACVGDVAAHDFGDKIVKTAVDNWGALHIIVNNAGFTWDSMIHKMSDAQWDKILDIHLKAPFRIIRAAQPYFCLAAKQRELFMRMIPLGRPGTVDEAAGVILFFASPLSNYVSGQILVCGGGFSM
jgi:3-oxoacyl-[acyl-carrier protein] reductase